MGGDLVAMDSTGVKRKHYGAFREPRPYRAIAAVTTRADTVYLFDVRAWSWLLFDSTGQLIARRAIRPDRTMRGFAARGGHLYSQLVPPGSKLGAPIETQIVQLDGESARTVASPEASATQTDSSDLVPMPPMFAAQPVWDIAADGRVIYSNGDTYTLLRYGATGTRESATVVSGTRGRPVTPADMSREQARRAGPGGAVDQAFAAAASRAAPTFGAITDLRALAGGVVVIRRAPDADGDSVRWDLWISDRLAGAMRLGAADHIIGGDSIRILVISTTTSTAPSRLAWLALGPLRRTP